MMRWLILFVPCVCYSQDWGRYATPPRLAEIQIQQSIPAPKVIDARLLPTYLTPNKQLVLPLPMNPIPSDVTKSIQGRILHTPPNIGERK